MKYERGLVLFSLFGRQNLLSIPLTYNGIIKKSGRVATATAKIVKE